MSEHVETLIQEYREGRINRREFMQRAVVLTGSLAAATSSLHTLLESSVYGAQVNPDDRALASSMVEFPGPAGTLSGYLSRPNASGNYPGIFIIHDRSAMSVYLQDVTRRFAKEGFVGLAVDYLSRKGGTAKVLAGEGIGSISALAPPEPVKADTGAAIAYLRTLKEVRGNKFGIIGFCWGGGRAFYQATQARDFGAVVVFYGRNPAPLDLVQRIEAPVLGHYGELDPRITKEVPQVEAVMKRYNKSFEYKIYAGARHAFHNDQSSTSHNAEAAKEAWSRTVEFFKKYLHS